ncbi:hypothetical protein [Streptomyces sp. NPDC057889]|uniref:hypothetical protein n=1 Tax=unclassified Streptomyces TaxID=2593676 RepID=UPI00369D1243
MHFKFKAKERKSRQQRGMRVVDSGRAAEHRLHRLVSAGAVGYPEKTSENLGGSSMQPGTSTDRQSVREDRSTAHSEVSVPEAQILLDGDGDGDGGGPETPAPESNIIRGQD